MCDLCGKLESILHVWHLLNPNFQIEQIEKGEPGRYRVTAQTNEGAEVVEEYNTVSTAIYNLIAAFFFFQIYFISNEM